MNVRKLFQVLVAGGAILAGVSTGCGGSGPDSTNTGGTTSTPDGGAPGDGGTAGGGGTHGW